MVACMTTHNVPFSWRGNIVRHNALDMTVLTQYKPNVMLLEAATKF